MRSLEPDQVDQTARGFFQPPFPRHIFFILLIFFIYLRYGNFFIFTLIFQFLISYFKLTFYFDVLSKPATSCSNLSLNVEGQGLPGHAAF